MYRLEFIPIWVLETSEVLLKKALEAPAAVVLVTVMMVGAFWLICATNVVNAPVLGVTLPTAACKLVPVAVPIFGVPVNTGETDIANVVPVPVCAATDVALPRDVIGPVRLALVVTVAALPAEVA